MSSNSFWTVKVHFKMLGWRDGRRGHGPPFGHRPDIDTTGETCKEKGWEDSLQHQEV